MLLKVIYILCYSFQENIHFCCVFMCVCMCVCVILFFLVWFLNDVPTFKITLIDPLHDKTNDLDFASSED